MVMIVAVQLLPFTHPAVSPRHTTPTRRFFLEISILADASRCCVLGCEKNWEFSSSHRVFP